MTQQGARAIVLDTSAFIGGFDPLSFSGEIHSVPAVEEELIPNSLPWTRFKTAVESGKLQLKAPARMFLSRVKESSKTVGDALVLSNVDLQVLARALELKHAGSSPLIVTDDYSIQNVADQLGLEFTSLMTFGIRSRHYWVLYCPACYRRYSPDYKSKVCQVCGTKLKRKPLRKTLLK